MAIHDDNWTKEFKKIGTVERTPTFPLVTKEFKRIGMLEIVSRMPLVSFIWLTACLYWAVPQMYQMAVSNPTEAMKFSLVSGGIVMVAIAIRAALKLYVNHTRK